MRNYLKVPYKDKDEAKALGARFDGSTKLWFAPPGVDLGKFARWLPGGAQGPQVGTGVNQHPAEPQKPPRRAPERAQGRGDGTGRDFYQYGRDSKPYTPYGPPPGSMDWDLPTFEAPLPPPPPEEEFTPFDDPYAGLEPTTPQFDYPWED